VKDSSEDNGKVQVMEQTRSVKPGTRQWQYQCKSTQKYAPMLKHMYMGFVKHDLSIITSKSKKRQSSEIVM